MLGVLHSMLGVLLGILGVLFCTLGVFCLTRGGNMCTYTNNFSLENVKITILCHFWPLLSILIVLNSRLRVLQSMRGVLWGLLEVLFGTLGVFGSHMKKLHVKFIPTITILGSFGHF